MLESDIKNPMPQESPEPSIEPSQAASQPFINPSFGVREIQATYEMVLGARAAIRANEHWKGPDLEHMAMLCTMLAQMEGQYRSQLELAKAREKAASKKTIDAIKSAGGTVNGEARTNAPSSSIS